MKNMNWKRATIFVLVLALLALPVTACKKQNDTTPTATPSGSTSTPATTQPAVETTHVLPGVATGLDLTGTEPITFTWLGGAGYNNVEYPVMETDAWKAITALTGVSIEFDDLSNTPDMLAKINTLLAGGELPDFIEADQGIMYDTVINSKQVVCFDDNDLVQTYGTNILKFETFVETERAKSPEGKLYCAPTACEGVNPKTMITQNAWNVRWDLYEELGYPEIKNLYDYIDVLGQMVALEPTNKDGLKNYALGMFFADSWGSIVLDNPEHFIRGYSHNTIAYFDMDCNFAGERLTDPDSIFWEMAAVYNYAYRKGLLDPESITMKYLDFNDKVNAQRYMGGGPYWMYAGCNDTFAADGTPEKGIMPVPIGEGGWEAYKGANWMHLQKNLAGFRRVFITNSCDDPERAMAILDFFATPEALTYWYAGAEGKQWDYVDGVPTLKDEFMSAGATDLISANSGIGRTIAINGDGSSLRADGYPADILNYIEVNFSRKEATPLERIYREYWNISYDSQKMVETVANYTQVGVVPTLIPDSEEANNLTKISAYVETAIGRVVFQETDEAFEAEKAAFIQTVKNMGSDAIIAQLSK
jgi:ABC-type glycerol-3-phosphate transport system substrate-binding protein